MRLRSNRLHIICSTANQFSFSSNRCRSIDGAENSSIRMAVGNDKEHSVFKAMVENCKRLESLSLCGLYFHSVHKCLQFTFDGIPGLKELVLKENEYPLYDLSVNANDYIFGLESEPYLAAVFQLHGAHLETFRRDFSDIFRRRKNTGYFLATFCSVRFLADLAAQHHISWLQVGNLLYYEGGRGQTYCGKEHRMAFIDK